MLTEKIGLKQQYLVQKKRVRGLIIQSSYPLTIPTDNQKSRFIVLSNNHFVACIFMTKIQSFNSFSSPLIVLRLSHKTYKNPNIKGHRYVAKRYNNIDDTASTVPTNGLNSNK